MVQPCVIQKNGKSKNKTNQKQTNKQKHKTKEHYIGGRDIQKTVGIPMDISCAPPFSDLIFYSYQTDFNRNVVLLLYHVPLNRGCSFIE